MLKPNTSDAMQQLLKEIEKNLPLRKPNVVFCRKTCVGCPKKLMAFIEQEVENWHFALSQGEVPSFGDISKLAKTSRKIHKALVKNGVL